MISISVIGGTLISLYALEKKGKISINSNIIKLILAAYSIKLGYENIEKILSVTFLKP